MRIWLKRVGGIILLLTAALQFTNPRHLNPTVQPGHDLLASNAPPAEVAALLKNACYNCHSDETVWPWYSFIAPLSWPLVGHVNDAREAMNFSQWPHDDPSHARKRWRRIRDAVDSEEMPLRSYTWIHPEARLTAEQRKRLVQWAEDISIHLKE
jgi:uncharacterized membrane protein